MVVTLVQKLSLAASVPTGRTLARGVVVTLTGTVLPVSGGAALPRVRFEVYVRVGSTWVLNNHWNVAVDSGGHARLTLTIASAGSWWIRATALSTSTAAASGWSNSFKYTFR
jgi:hypothetical protein